jgi:hypothetical protein
MEPKLETNKWQIIAKFSLIFTLILVAVNLMFYITGMQTKLSVVMTILTILVIGGSIYKGILTERNQVLGGFITYGEGVKIGLLITLFASILLTFYNYIFVEFIDVDFMDNMIKEAKRQMIEDGSSEEEIEMGMKMFEYMKSPWVFALGGFAGYFFYGLIASLIVAIFTKREDPDAQYKSLQN